MATSLRKGVLEHLRRSALLRQEGGLSDGQLLECFLTEREEAALEALVRRHGGMVLGVCRRILGNTHDAEDAFQAVFLVLVRKAASIHPRDMVGNWLYGVAYRTALKARAMTSKRRAREKQVRDLPATPVTDPASWDDLQPLLDRELHRLPDNYRTAVLLCDVEGVSRREAAHQLGWPEGTLHTRLMRARELLARRLTRRGIALSAGGLAMTLSQNAVVAAVPVPLASATVKAVLGATGGLSASVTTGVFTGGQAASGTLSTEVVALADGVVRGMFLVKIKSVLAVLLLAGTLGGGGMLLRTDRTQPEPPTNPEPGIVLAQQNEETFPPPAPEEPTTREDRGVAVLQGKVIDVGADGKTFTIESSGRNRRDETDKHDILVDDKTQFTFSGVGLGGARLAPGLVAQVWREGTNPTATKVSLQGTERVGDPDISGRVSRVAPDGSSITFDFGPRTRGGEAKTVTIRLTERTQQVFSAVTSGGAGPAEGYDAAVWFEPGSRDTAATVHFRGNEGLDRGAPRPSHAGKVVAVSRNTVTIEIAPSRRGDEPASVVIKLTGDTRLVYQNIASGGDHPSVGHTAQVWLTEGSADIARLVAFRDTPRERHNILRGQVVSVADDEKSIVLELPTPDRGEEPRRITIRLTDRSRVVFQGVGSGGARPSTGQAAQVWLEEGTRDSAAQVLLSPPRGER